MDETYGTYVDDECFDILIMILTMILMMILMMLLMMMLMMVDAGTEDRSQEEPYTFPPPPPVPLPCGRGGVQISGVWIRMGEGKGESLNRDALTRLKTSGGSADTLLGSNETFWCR